MAYEVRLETLTHQRPLAVVRRRAALAELSSVVPECCGLVWNALRTQGIKGAGRHVAVYRDNEINLEVGVELDHPFTDAGEVVPSSLPAGTVATTVHLGPYAGLGAAHQAIHDWCKARGHAPVRPCWEVYAHWDQAWNHDPASIRTDVFYLLAP